MAQDHKIQLTWFIEGFLHSISIDSYLYVCFDFGFDTEFHQIERWRLIKSTQTRDVYAYNHRHRFELGNLDTMESKSLCKLSLWLHPHNKEKGKNISPWLISFRLP